MVDYELVALRLGIFCWTNSVRLWVVLSGVFSSLWVMFGVVFVACLVLAGLVTVLSPSCCSFIISVWQIDSEHRVRFSYRRLALVMTFTSDNDIGQKFRTAAFLSDNI